MKISGTKLNEGKAEGQLHRLMILDKDGIHTIDTILFYDTINPEVIAKGSLIKIISLS